MNLTDPFVTRTEFQAMMDVSLGAVVPAVALALLADLARGMSEPARSEMVARVDEMAATLRAATREDLREAIDKTIAALEKLMVRP